MKFAHLEIEHPVAVASLGIYITEHLRRGIGVVIKPSDSYQEEMAKGPEPIKHLDLGAKKV